MAVDTAIETAAEGAAGRAVEGPAELPRVRFTRGRLLALVLVAGSVALFLYFVLPKLLGLRDTWDRIDGGDPWWLGLAAILEVLSFASYVALLRSVCVRRVARVREASGIRWRESYQITMASLAATRLFAAAGAGGIALTAWALRRSGLGPRTVAARMLAFLTLLYAVYMAAFVICGLGLYLGVFPGPGPFAITVVPAIFGGVVIGLFLAIAFLPGDLERVVAGRIADDHWPGKAARWLAAMSATAAVGVRTAIELVRSRDPFLLGAVGWWGFDIAVLWACFHAFGSSPPEAVIVLAYFVGMLGNTLPLPGGIGGVDGGMIGAFTAFGVNVEVSVVAVLAYRALAFWLPTLPGAVAYFQLRRTVQRWRSAPGPSEPSISLAGGAGASHSSRLPSYI
jgi:putative heme transporter